MTTRGGLLVLCTAAMLIGSACGSSAPSTSTANTLGSRPITKARLEIASPAPNAVTNRSVHLVLHLAGARLVPPTQVGGRILPDRGHIHVSVDGQLVAMPLQLDDPLPALSPGVHTVEAEFVASDHLPFENRVVAAVTFRVR